MRQKFFVKIFKLKRTQYPLTGLDFKTVVSTIIENHKRHIYAGPENINTFNIQFESSETDEFKFASYCYNQPTERHYWKSFLPDYIGQSQNFSITKFSYVLFIEFKLNIYCVIGGIGIGVIKSYINTSFGIDTYSRLAKPSEDLILEIKSRSIANNVSLQTTTYNYNQTVLDTVAFSEIPSVMKIVIRDELKRTFFRKYNLHGTQSLLEVGSYFCLRSEISFDDLLELVRKLDNLIETVKPVDLSFFRKIEDENTIKIMDDKLMDILVQNVKNFSHVKDSDYERNDIDIVHPNKLELFYECDHYKIRRKGSRGDDDVIIDNRQMLYTTSIEHIYGRLENNFTDFNIINEIRKNQINGIRNGKEITFQSLLNHVVAELEVDNRKYFRIDREWYLVKDIFIEKLSTTAAEYYQRYELKESILLPWEHNLDEGKYNLKHNSKNSYVLDKILIDNIEICDILIEKDNKLYFVHVKDGFDVKLRDCYIQVVLASRKLKIDLRDQNGKNYLVPSLNKYNGLNPKNIIDIENMRKRISNRKLEVIFVLAYRNKSATIGSAVDKIQASKSNIAKYSIVNVVKEMKEDFEIRLLDIGSI